MPDGDKVEMALGAAERFVARLGMPGDGLDRAWSMATGQLAAVEQLGGGPMGARFLAAYHPVDTQLRGATSDAVERAARLSGAGRKSVSAYDDGGERATSAMAEPGRDNLRLAVEVALRSVGFAVDTVADLPAADEALYVNAYDGAVVDRMLPSGDALHYVARQASGGPGVAGAVPDGAGQPRGPGRWPAPRRR